MSAAGATGGGEREDALRILRAGVAGAEPGEAVRRSLSVEGRTLLIRSRDAMASGGDHPLAGGGAGGRDAGGRRGAGGTDGALALPLEEGGQVVLLAVGKAAGTMARAASALLGDLPHDGAMTVPAAGSPTAPPSRGAADLPADLTLWEAAHPVPDIGGLAAAGDALGRARRAGARDLVLCLLSGGASALWAAPAPGLTLDDLRAAGQALLRSGAPIEAVNTVRRHLSAIAGGGLALAARPAPVVTLAVCDVIGSEPGAIGSGPTLPDPSTHAQALEVVRRWEVDLPPAALHHLHAGVAGAVPETPKDGALGNVRAFEVVLDIGDALAAAAAEAERLGYDARVVTAGLRGEAAAVGSSLAARALAARPQGGRGVALLWGGETTVTVRGAGRGGRNQELALAAAMGLQGEPGVVLASAGTDGRDGPTDAAGAVVDGETIERGRAAGLDAADLLRQNDSYRFLGATGDLIVTGPTGTNVNDLVVALVSPSPAAGSA